MVFSMEIGNFQIPKQDFQFPQVSRNLKKTIEYFRKWKLEISLTNLLSFHKIKLFTVDNFDQSK